MSSSQPTTARGVVVDGEELRSGVVRGGNRITASIALLGWW